MLFVAYRVRVFGELESFLTFSAKILRLAANPLMKTAFGLLGSTIHRVLEG